MSLAFSGEKHPQWGIKHSPEAIERMIAAQKNRSPEWRARIAAAKMGAKHPLAQKVVCLNLGLVFDTTREAARWLGKQDASVKSVASRIGKACNSRKKIAYELEWQFADTHLDAY
jgi:hypothetical protein